MPARIEEPLNAIEDLKESINEASCDRKEPFIKLGTGSAPTLNYNIPQTTAFSSYGHVDSKINPLKFKDNTRLEPEGNLWQAVDEVDVNDLATQIAENAQMQNDADPINANNALNRTWINNDISNFKKVAEGKSAAEGEANLYNDKFVNETQMAKTLKKGYRPFTVRDFSGKNVIRYIKKPINPNVKIFIIEEYRTLSYLGDYGAGRTLSTFTLLPGEKTTISIKTFKQIQRNRSYSENIIDSFSEESASEMEKLTETESSGTTAVTTSSNETTNFGINGKLDLTLSGKIKKIIDATGNLTIAADYSQTNNLQRTANTTSNVRMLEKALSKHVERSNHHRSVNVNTAYSENFTESEEQSTVRELVNVNKSRVLNFVFRQLMQEYVTITYLADVKFVFSNGYPEGTRMSSIEDLQAMLEDIIEPDDINGVKVELLSRYCKVRNYNNTMVNFIKNESISYATCLGVDVSEDFYTIDPAGDTYTSGGLSIHLPGPVLSAQKHTLRTDSVVCDALLGQGEALDCYNMKLQDADGVKAYLENLELVQKINTLEQINDPLQRTDAYKKIFGNCCETPQTQIIS